jgi:hypothetical protein
MLVRYLREVFYYPHCRSWYYMAIAFITSAAPNASPIADRVFENNGIRNPLLLVIHDLGVGIWVLK